MKLLDVKTLAIPEIKVIRFARFPDHRGYFAEHFRQSDFRGHPDLAFMKDVEFVQANESFSRTGTIRGMHLQWSPYMGKLVRTVAGRMIDLVLDVRRGSPTCGKMIAYDIPSRASMEHAEWIWVPPGFAHGNVFPAETVIEYFCSGQYSPGCEASISPLAQDIDWSLCEPALKALFDEVAGSAPLMTDKDREGLSMAAWLADPRSENFRYAQGPR